jgi:hypothetical protein
VACLRLGQWEFRRRDEIDLLDELRLSCRITMIVRGRTSHRSPAASAAGPWACRSHDRGRVDIAEAVDLSCPESQSR